MESDHTYYVFKLIDLAWNAAETGVLVIDILVALAVVVLIRVLELKNKLPKFLSLLKKHPIIENDSLRLVIVFGLIFFGHVIFISPYLLYKVDQGRISILEESLNDKSPRLEGFINRSFITDEPGTSNSLIFFEMEIGNSGGSPSSADQFGLFLVTANATNIADEVYFTNEYTFNFFNNGKPYLLDLKRSELISEKAHNAIQPGDSPRGWTAFRLNGVPLEKYSPTNLVLRFFDIDDKKTLVTNTATPPMPPGQQEQDAITAIFPGSDNIIHPIQPEIRTNWLPPELPPGCSNVIVFFGSEQFNYPRQFAEAAAETNGIEFAIKDLPNGFLRDLDTMPGYSPRRRSIWLRESGMNVSVGGKTFSFPVQPIIISNRLYIEVEVPFSNGERKLEMSDAFDQDLLTIPPLWDRNYSTNYDEYGNGYYYYEIVNELTNPVLQVAYAAPNVVIVNGIFKVDQNSIYAAFGQPPMLLTFSNRLYFESGLTQRITTVSLQSTNFFEILDVHTNDTFAEVGEMWTNEFYRPIFQYQHRIFKYPSYLNLGVFDWPETNNADTNIVGKNE